MNVLSFLNYWLTTRLRNGLQYLRILSEVTDRTNRSREEIDSRYHAFVVCLLGGVADAQISLLGSFDPSELGQLNAIGFDSSSETVYLHESRSDEVHQYSPAGELLRSIPDRVNQGNDSDLEFSDVPLQLAGTLVPANTLLVTANEILPPQFSAVDKETGDVLAQLDLDRLAIGRLTGGAYHPLRNSLFVIDWTMDLIHEVELAGGSILNSFGFGENWDAFFSDVEVAPGSNRLYLVSSLQPRIRVLESDGTFVHDVDVTRLGISGMSGIAFENDTGHAWISSSNGTVYHVADLATARLCGPIGDFDCSETLDAADINELTHQVRTGILHPFLDVNEDRRMNLEDRRVWVHELKKTYFGDADLDGEFNSTDLVSVFVAGEYEDGIAMNSSWESGDWNGDGEFNTADFVLAFTDGGYELGPRGEMNLVPEPTSSWLAIAGIVGLLKRRRASCRPRP